MAISWSSTLWLLAATLSRLIRRSHVSRREHKGQCCRGKCNEEFAEFCSWSPSQKRVRVRISERAHSCCFTGLSEHARSSNAVCNSFKFLFAQLLQRVLYQFHCDRRDWNLVNGLCVFLSWYTNVTVPTVAHKLYLWVNYHFPIHSYVCVCVRVRASADRVQRQEREVMLKLKEVVDRQRDDLRAKVQQITTISKEVEAVRT